MLLVTGPTGSGKTSTLHALLREMKLESRCDITIEDPVEYRAEGVNQIAVSLAFVIDQRLVRTLCPDRKKATSPDATDARWLRRVGAGDLESGWEARGCEVCHDTGYTGRTGVFEVVPVDEEIYDVVLGGGDEHALRAKFRQLGVGSLLADGLDKLAHGIKSVSELRDLGGRDHVERATP